MANVLNYGRQLQQNISKLIGGMIKLLVIHLKFRDLYASQNRVENGLLIGYFFKASSL